MSKEKWTPGPWVVDYEGTLGHVKAVPLGSVPHVDRTPTVCKYDSNVLMIADERKANAHLISAAPELYKALILLRNEMIESGNAGSEDYGWKPAIEATNSALAKARGES